MAFKFATRTLLELGKELISTDEVAIYELIKNSIDAGSDVVTIVFNICLLRSHYNEAINALDKKQPMNVIRERLKGQLLTSADTESTEAFMHAIDAAENPASFRKTPGEAEGGKNWNEGRDRGLRNSFKETEEIYLTVGTRDKRKKNLKGAN